MPARAADSVTGLCNRVDGFLRSTTCRHDPRAKPPCNANVGAGQPSDVSADAIRCRIRQACRSDSRSRARLLLLQHMLQRHDVGTIANDAQAAVHHRTTHTNRTLRVCRLHAGKSGTTALDTDVIRQTQPIGGQQHPAHLRQSDVSGYLSICSSVTYISNFHFEAGMKGRVDLSTGK
jgi:hypothetical protein